MRREYIIQKLDNIAKQFLCKYPLHTFKWQNILDDEFLTDIEQEYLLTKTVNSDLVLKYPIEIKYQKLFLKQIISKLEYLQLNNAQATVIHDNLYSTYGRLVAADDSSEENFKHYSFYCDNSYRFITLKESNNLISDGTTGLRTWQASLALSEWIILNKNIFKNKIVLELGSGIGLTGLIVKTCCDTKSVYLTDCHEIVLNTLCSNVELNLGKTNNKHLLDNDNLDIRYFYQNTLTILSVMNLPWEKFNLDICKSLGIINKVIAADIVYDNSLFNSLVNAINCLKNYCGTEEFILACTERNSDTLEEFLGLMKNIFSSIDECVVPQQFNFVWPTDTPLRIFRFKD